MKKIFIAATLSFVPFYAMAADSPSHKTLPVAAEALPVFTWTGFYAGVSVGQSTGKIKLDDALLIGVNNFGAIGETLGVLAGYDQMISDRWLIGAQIAASASTMASKSEVTELNGAATMKLSEVWSGKLTGRLGYLASPNTLVFASFGALMSQGTGSVSVVSNGIPDVMNSRKRNFQGVTTALGIETKFTGNWRGRFEYDMDFLRSTSDGNSVFGKISPEIGAAKISLIYGFGERVHAASNTIAPTWTGAYLGMGAGHSQASTKYNLSNIQMTHATIDGLGASGWSGSLLLGYNYQLNSSFVIGAEVIGSLSSLGSKYGDSGKGAEIESHTPDWLSQRMRLGYLLAPETMVYGSVGYTEQRSTLKSTQVSGLLEKYNFAGVEFGGGVETWLSKNVTARLHYSVSNLMKVDILKEEPFIGTIEKTQSNGLAAVSYHF